MVSMEEIVVKITGKDDLSPVLKRIASNLNEITTEGAKTGKTVDSSFAHNNENIKQATNTLQNYNNHVKENAVALTQGLNKAKGDDLDRLLEPFIERQHGRWASTEIILEFYEEAPEDLLIERGLRIKSRKNPDIFFETPYSVTVRKGEKKKCISATCPIPGPGGNVPSGDLCIIDETSSELSKLIKYAHNPYTATGGCIEEDDEAWNMYELKSDQKYALSTRNYASQTNKPAKIDVWFYNDPKGSLELDNEVYRITLTPNS